MATSTKVFTFKILAFATSDEAIAHYDEAICGSEPTVRLPGMH
jgi:hypothetical protein